MSGIAPEPPPLDLREVARHNQRQHYFTTFLTTFDTLLPAEPTPAQTCHTLHRALELTRSLIQKENPQNAQPR